jgi:hypothetical protein
MAKRIPTVLSPRESLILNPESCPSLVPTSRHIYRNPRVEPHRPILCMRQPLVSPELCIQHLSPIWPTPLFALQVPGRNSNRTGGLEGLLGVIFDDRCPCLQLSELRQ